MHLVLGLPSLLAARESLPELPGLAQLLYAAGGAHPDADSVPHALATRFGVARDGDWPLGAIALRYFGHDPGSDWWLAAAPVTLVAGRDDVRVAGAVTDLSSEEATSLVGLLNAHFAPDEVRFVAATPQHWFLGSRRAHAITTHPLARAIGAPLLDLLPQGPEYRRWRRWQNEIEMLLHDHPVNALREAQARAIANGVWFSDGGTLPPPVRPLAGRTTFADDPTVRALAAYAGEAHAATPADLDAARAAAPSSSELVVVLAAEMAPGAIDARWTLPAWRALSAGALSRVTVVAGGRSVTLRWAASRPGLAARTAARLVTPKLGSVLPALLPDA